LPPTLNKYEMAFLNDGTHLHTLLPEPPRGMPFEDFAVRFADVHIPAGVVKRRFFYATSDAMARRIAKLLFQDHSGPYRAFAARLFPNETRALGGQSLSSAALDRQDGLADFEYKPKRRS